MGLTGQPAGLIPVMVGENVKQVWGAHRSRVLPANFSGACCINGLQTAPVLFTSSQWARTIRSRPTRTKVKLLHIQ